MKIKHSFDPAFDDLMQELFDKTPDEILKLEGIHPDQLDINEATKAFFRKSDDHTTADVSIDANANVSGKDTITYAYELSKPISKLNSLFNLWKNMKEQFGEDDANHAIKANVLGNLYINDAWDIGRPYCFNYSTNDIALEGLKMSNRLVVDPPKSLYSFLRQVEQFVVYAANSTLGATGLADLLIVAAGYVKNIKETGYDNHIAVCNLDRYVKELLTSTIYTLNWEFRGNQSAFTNVSVYDRAFLKNLLPSYVILGRPVELVDVCYVQGLFLDCMDEILSRTPITFPVVTACFAVEEKDGKREVVDYSFLKEISKANLKHGYINIYMGKSSTLSSCCRLRSESEGLGYTNSFGSGSTKIGSLGVVTLNLPRMAELSLQDCTSYDTAPYDFLDAVVGGVMEASMINHAKRCFLRDRIARGSLSLYTLGYMSLDRQYSTCGYTGLYEALEILGFDIKTPEGLMWAKRILQYMQKTNKLMQSKFGTPHNLEQVPAESSAVKLARKDKVLGLNEDYELYANQFIPLFEDASIMDRLTIQGELDPFCDGGSILHINAAQPVRDVDTMARLIEVACAKGVVYFAINLVLCQCANHHTFVSNEGANYNGKCPICGADVTDEYTRVVGFLTNTKHWNSTRKKFDYPQRKFYLKEEN